MTAMLLTIMPTVPTTSTDTLGLDVVIGSASIELNPVTSLEFLDSDDNKLSILFSNHYCRNVHESDCIEPCTQQLLRL